MAYIRVIESSENIDKKSLSSLFSMQLTISLGRANILLTDLLVHGEVFVDFKSNKEEIFKVLEKESKQLGLEIEIDIFRRMLAFSVFEDTVINEIKYFYRKFEEGDCDPTDTELVALENCLNEIKNVRDKIRRIYDNH